MNAPTAPSVFWRDEALAFIEARAVSDGRKVCYAKHSHETFSIGLVTQGTSTYLNRDAHCRIDAGTLVLMNPGDVHACNPIADQPWAYRMLYVDTCWLVDLQRQLGIRDPGFRRFSPIMTRDSSLRAGFNDFFETFTDQHAASLEKHSAAASFFSDVYRRLNTAPTVPLHEPTLQRAAEFIADNYKRTLKLDEICQVAGVSASCLIRSFKKHYGMTPHAFLINRRIQFARAELRRGKPIIDVALEAGFADQAHLQRAFKQLLAATPGHYRDYSAAACETGADPSNR